MEDHFLLNTLLSSGESGDDVSLLDINVSKVSRISDLSVEELIQCVDFGLHVIKQTKFVEKFCLSEKVSMRHRQCASIAKEVKSLGYSKECGYNQLLYPTEKSSRDLLGWIVEKIANIVKKRDGKRGQETSVKVGSDRVNDIMNKWVRESWVACPLFLLEGEEEDSTSSFLKTFPVNHEKLATLQFGKQFRKSVATSLIQDKQISDLENINNSLNSVDLDRVKEKEQAKKTLVQELMAKRAIQASQLMGFEKINGEEEEEEEEDDDDEGELEFEENVLTTQTDNDYIDETELENLNKEEMQLQSEIENLTLSIKEAKASIKEVTKAGKVLERELESIFDQKDNLEDEYLIKTKVLEMLPEADENVKRLSKEMEIVVNRIESLEKDWKEHQIPYVEKLKQIRDKDKDKRRDLKRKIVGIKRMKEEIKNIKMKMKLQNKKKAVLETSLQNLPQAQTTRTSYTQRILDIINQVQKQNREIDRIVQDIRNIQKSINQASEKLQRMEIITDEKIFYISDERRNDVFTTRAYRYLHDMRVLFDELIHLVGETGKATNNARDLGSRIDNLKTKVSQTNLERLLGDLEEIKKENKQLQMNK